MARVEAAWHPIPRPALALSCKVQNGVEGLIIGGTTGEGQLMSWDEHIMLIAHTGESGVCGAARAGWLKVGECFSAVCAVGIPNNNSGRCLDGVEHISHT